MQPIVIDDANVLRFKPNRIVRFLLDAGPFDLNMLALMPFDDDERAQLAQLIGYSLSGYGELPYVSEAAYHSADLAAGGVRAEARAAALTETKRR